MDAQAVADHLEALARTAQATRFSPRGLPEGADAAVLHRAAILRARAQVATAHGEQDRILAQEVRAIDDLVRSANLLVERLREWYALHAPEAVRAADAKLLAQLVATSPDRAAVGAALHLADEVSLGTELAAADVAVLRVFAVALKSVHEAWEALDGRVQTLMESVAPNVAAVVGPVLGARLIAQAGNLQRLAGFPSGTVQTLGAETALFRHIKEGTRPPKHGILFQHPKVFQAPPWQRGPVARALALHVSLAARADAYTQRDLRPQLMAGVEKDLARIARDRPRPPERGRPAGKWPAATARAPPRAGKGDYGRVPGKPGNAPRGPLGGPPRAPARGAERSSPGGERPASRAPPRAAAPRRGPSDGRSPPGKGRSGPPDRRDGRPGDRSDSRRDDRRGDRRDDRRDDKRRKGPGAFRRQGDGPAPPPGGKK
ncbi:MAG TPA: NOP5/NOP56 family protein [bacterium]